MKSKSGRQTTKNVKSGPSLESQHPVSHRTALFQDNGICAYLFMIDPKGDQISAGVFVHNRINPPSSFEDAKTYSPDAIPLWAECANEQARCIESTIHRWEIIWSTTGDAAAVLKNGFPVAFISNDQEIGYSRGVKSNCEFGKVWSDIEYERAFGTG